MTGDAIVIQAARRSGRLVVTEAQHRRSKLTVVLDTGAQISIGNEALRQQLARKMPRDAQIVELQSVTGEKISGEYAFVRELTSAVSRSAISRSSLPMRTLQAAESRTTSPALLLGMNAMRAFKKVSIDFANRKFRVLLPEHSALDVQTARIGDRGTSG